MALPMRLGAIQNLFMCPFVNIKQQLKTSLPNVRARQMTNSVAQFRFTKAGLLFPLL